MGSNSLLGNTLALVGRWCFSAYLMIGRRLRAGMALGPQLIGHTSYNWSLKHVSATFVAVVTLGEPIGSALMTFVFFGETLASVQAVGFGLLPAGIYLAAKGEK